jgi:hypothetical protein
MAELLARPKGSPHLPLKLFKADQLDQVLYISKKEEQTCPH